MLTIRPARLEPRASAISSSTAQNSGSSAMEVAWPVSRTERFFRVAMRVLFTNFTVGKTSPLQKDDGGVIFVGSRLKQDSPPMAMTADTADFRPEARPMSTKLDWGHALRSL